MIVAIGYKSERPPERIKNLLSGPLMRQSTIRGKKGYMRFMIQNLESYRDEKSGILPVIGMKEISWREDDGLLIGEVE